MEDVLRVYEQQAQRQVFNQQAPNEQAPNEQAPNEQAPNEQAPNEQAPRSATPREQSSPGELAVVELAVVELAVVEPAVVEPAVVEPAVVEPAVVEPAVVEPAVVEPALVRLCFDERPCQLLDEVLAPLPLKQGKPLRQDYEYERKGRACVLLAYDLDKGQRYVQVRERRTKKDYAQFMDWLVKEHYPKAQKIHLVQDNLNTHSMSSFYEHLPLERAGELAQKMQFHFTPKHGSWLNMAEIEFSALARQCLDRRIKDIHALQTEVRAWSQQRNKDAVKIHWSFTVKTARVTLASRYQKVNPGNSDVPNN